MSKEWIIQPPWDGCADAAARWNVPPLVAQILHNRLIQSPQEARSFLCPQLADLHPPEQLPGASQAARHICAALKRGDRIVLYGDYDVDGITGVAILWHVLSAAGGDISFYVPHRIEEGYGMNPAAVKGLAAEGARLIISVDCGIAAVEVARLARQLGVDLIVTDHHEPRAEKPEALIVHPTVGGECPNPHLCGAGVAFKLAWAIAQELAGAQRVSPPFRNLLAEALPLAALGTIADVVPLTGENRVLARCGLARLKECSLHGVRALLEVSGLTGADVDDTDVGFKIAPRLNAAGRMGHARLAVELLTRADEQRAREIAKYLDDQNRVRQSKQRRLVKQACEMIERTGQDGDAQRAVVLAAENWHPGIIGIVAGRLVDRYHKPAVLIALENGVGQGSARSVPYFELHTALEACSAHLISHGGHAMAAGLRIRADAIPAFTAAFVTLANNTLSGTAVRHSLRIEGQVKLPSLDERTVMAIQSLGPFGVGNPRPLFVSGWLDLSNEPRCVGRSGEHLQLSLSDEDGLIRGIAFGAAGVAEALKQHRRCRVAFEPIINDFNGRRRVELQVVDFKFPD